VKLQQRYLDLARDLGGEPNSPLSQFAKGDGRIRNIGHAKAMMNQLSDIVGDMLFGRHTRERDLEDIGDFMAYLNREARKRGNVKEEKHLNRELRKRITKDVAVESVTGIGGRQPDDSLGDPAADVSMGHLGLDENGGGKSEAYKQQVRTRLDNLSTVYGPEKARGMLSPQERAALEEGSRIEFRSRHGVVYSGLVRRRYGRNLVVEVAGGRCVSTTTDDPTVWLLRG